MTPISIRLIALILASAATPSSNAAPFADPTRPPNAVADPEGVPSAVEGPRLESVLIAPDRRIAVISGQQYRTGDKYGEGRIVRITESAVTVRNGETTEILKLFPGIEKRPRPRRAKG